MNEYQIAKKLYEFGADLYDQLIGSDINDPSNIVFSPFSIHIALSMIYMGADAETYKEIGNALKYGRNGDKNEIAKTFRLILRKLDSETGLKIVNKIFVKANYNLHRNFQHTIVHFFDSRVSNVNFMEGIAAAKKINKWVSEKTNGTINDIVSSHDFDKLTRAVLINTIYFKGKWRNNFYSEFTRKMPFWSTPIKFVEVDMMRQHEQLKYGNLEKLDATVLEMDYVDSQISMMFILPNKKDGLGVLQKKFHKMDLHDVRKQMREEHVALFLPKFTFSFNLKLKEILTNFGLKTAFDENTANFSKLKDPTIDEPFWLSDIVHQAFIKVDEEGTEASAVTRFSLRGGGSGPPVIFHPFNVDHPFMFMVVLNNFVLFSGCVHNPSSH